MDHLLGLCNTAKAGTRAGTEHGMEPSMLGICWRRVMQRGDAKAVTLAYAQVSKSSLADARSICQHRLKHRLKLAGRSTDDLQHFRGRRLLLQCFTQIIRALLQLVEHPCVFDRDDGLAGEIADQCDLISVKRSTLLAIDADHTAQGAFFEQGNRLDCSVTAEFGAGNRKRVTLAVGLAIHAIEHLHESFRSRSVDNGGARSGTQ